VVVVESGAFVTGAELPELSANESAPAATAPRSALPAPNPAAAPLKPRAVPPPARSPAAHPRGEPAAPAGALPFVTANPYQEP